MGILLDGTDCKILLDSGKRSLHYLSMVTSKAKVIQIRDGESLNILFNIPIITTIHGQMFEIYTLVSVIYDVDFVLGAKNIEELER